MDSGHEVSYHLPSEAPERHFYSILGSRKSLKLVQCQNKRDATSVPGGRRSTEFVAIITQPGIITEGTVLSKVPDFTLPSTRGLGILS